MLQIPVAITIEHLQQLRRFKMAITNYKFVKANSQINPSLQHIQRYVDGVLESNTFIPQDPDNTDYQIYLAWVAEGNTAEAAD